MKYLQEHWFTAIVLGVAAVIILALLVKHAFRIRRFFIEVGGELAKCSWPWDPQQVGLKRYKELIDSTTVVVVSTLLLAGFVTASDFVLVKVIGFLTRFHT